MTSTETAEDFLIRYYGHIDGGRLDQAMDMMSPQAGLRFANNERVEGRDAIAAALGSLLDSVAGIRHELVNILDGDLPTVTYEVLVTYIRKDGSEVTVPGVAVVEIEGDVFTDQRIYIDLSPVFVDEA